MREGTYNNPATQILSDQILQASQIFAAFFTQLMVFIIYIFLPRACLIFSLYFSDITEIPEVFFLDSYLYEMPKVNFVSHYFFSSRLALPLSRPISQLILTTLLWSSTPNMALHAEEIRAYSSANKSRFHSPSSSSAIQLEKERIADVYAPLPIVIARAEGAHVWDPEGRQYLDFLSAYSVVNQGHCHPALVKALVEQASRLTITSRAFYSDVLPKWAEKVTNVFGYEKVLPMCTGAEAVETAVKLARKWAYKTKKVSQNEAWVFGAQGNFHGRTVSEIEFSVLFI